jgi:hypothetical protein
MLKNCCGNWQCCSYAIINSSSYVGCSYCGYCDYQLPKDSRSWQMSLENNSPNNTKEVDND